MAEMSRGFRSIGGRQIRGVEVARLSDVLRRPADGVGTLQVSYAGRLIEERVGSRRPGYVAVGVRICGR